MVMILQLVLYIIAMLFIPYLGLIFVNVILLTYVVPSNELLPNAVKNSNLQIQRLLQLLNNLRKKSVCYSDFYDELIYRATELSSYLNTIKYPNGVEWDDLNFYLWLSKIPGQEILDDWKMQLRQTVRSYDDNLDVHFTMIEEEPFLKLKMNLVNKDDLNKLENGQAKPLYSDEGEV